VILPFLKKVCFLFFRFFVKFDDFVQIFRGSPKRVAQLEFKKNKITFSGIQKVMTRPMTWHFFGISKVMTRPMTWHFLREISKSDDAIDDVDFKIPVVIYNIFGNVFVMYYKYYY
jgi:hypothetical protein